MNETTFENVQVNDKVYDILRGWGTIVEIRSQHNTIEVSFPNHSRGTYFIDGKADRRENRRLYWEQPEIHADPRPARATRKTITKYANVFKRSPLHPDHFDVFLHDTWNECHGENTGAIAVAIPVTIQFTMEE